MLKEEQAKEPGTEPGIDVVTEKTKPLSDLVNSMNFDDLVIGVRSASVNEPEAGEKSNQMDYSLDMV